MSSLFRNGLALGFIPLCAFSVGCINMQPYGATTSAAPVAPRPAASAPAQDVANKETASTAEPWVSGPTRGWPQIVLTNHATFVGHTALEGASSFLIRARDGQVYGVTARHLIRSDGGVEPPMDPSDLRAALREWWVFPRTKSETAMQLVRDGADGTDTKAFDVLVLSVKDRRAELAAYPLQVRHGHVDVGEKVYLVGCPYEEKSCNQNVYPGAVIQRMGATFAFGFAPPVNLRGFSGAPVLDERGHAVGVLSARFSEATQDNRSADATAEDLETILDASTSIAMF